MTAYRYLALLAVGIGCRADSGLRVERIGTDDDRPFAIVGGDVLLDNGHQIERVGPGGTVRWRSEARGKWAIPRGGTRSAFVVGVSENVSKAPLLDVDLATGVPRRRCVIRPGAYAQWYRFDDVLMLADLGSLERIDINTCDYVWSKIDAGTPVDLPTSDEFWVHRTYKVSAFAIADGSKREMDAGTWVSITPDGRTLVTDFGASVAAFDTKSLRRTWTYPGRPDTAISSVAASDRWIAVESIEANVANSRVTVTVLRRSDGKPVWSHRSSRGQFLGYVAAGGDLIAYYDSEDTSLHAVHLPDGKTGIVQKFERGFFISTERSGIAPAVPDKAPRIDGDLMIVYDTPTTRAYRVRPRP